MPHAHKRYMDIDLGGGELKFLGYGYSVKGNKYCYK